MSGLFGDIPSWIPAEEWADFVEMRKAKGKRAPWTPAAQKYIVRALDRLRGQGCNPAEVLAQSVMNGWSGVFAVKAHQQALDQAKPSETDYERTQRLLREQAQHKVGKEGLEAFKARMGMQ